MHNITSQKSVVIFFEPFSNNISVWIVRYYLIFHIRTHKTKETALA